MPNKVQGIYQIVNKLDGKIYTGSAISIHSRWSDHRKHLRAETPDVKQVNIHLYRAWKRDGEDAFDFCIVEEVADAFQLEIREQWHIDQVPENLRYNMCSVAGSCLGRRHSLQARQNISKARSGIPSIKTAEHLANISAALRGKRPSDAALEASAAKRRGKPLSDEHKQKVSAGLKGKKRPPRTPEQIEHYRQAALLRMANCKNREDLSRTMKELGIAPSDEARRLAREKKHQPPQS